MLLIGRKELFIYYKDGKYFIYAIIIYTVVCPLCNGLKIVDDIYKRCEFCTFKCGYENPPPDPKNGHRIYFCEKCKGKGFIEK